MRSGSASRCPTARDRARDRGRRRTPSVRTASRGDRPRNPRNRGADRAGRTWPPASSRWPVAPSGASRRSLSGSDGALSWTRSSRPSRRPLYALPDGRSTLCRRSRLDQSWRRVPRRAACRPSRPARAHGPCRDRGIPLGRDRVHEPGDPAGRGIPESTEEVATIVRLAAQHRTVIVPRGAGTGLSGGAIAIEGALTLVMTRMNRILEIDTANQLAVVQPGIINADLGRAVAEHGLFYPPDPASFETCSIGGNLAENSGGLRCVKYGVTRDFVMGLEVVLADGSVIRTGGRTVKDVMGYDLTRLFVGSEGTLGVITEATLRLKPARRAEADHAGILPQRPRCRRGSRRHDAGGSGAGDARTARSLHDPGRRCGTPRGPRSGRRRDADDRVGHGRNRCRSRARRRRGGVECGGRAIDRPLDRSEGSRLATGGAAQGALVAGAGRRRANGGRGRATIPGARAPGRDRAHRRRSHGCASASSGTRATATTTRPS